MRISRREKATSVFMISNSETHSAINQNRLPRCIMTEQYQNITSVLHGHESFTGAHRFVNNTLPRFSANKSFLVADIHHPQTELLQRDIQPDDFR